MASIIKRKTKYSIIYTYIDSNGTKRQKWETCGSYAAAKKRKAELEHQIDTGVFIPPSASTLSDFLDEYVSLYGVNIWAPSTFDGRTALIDNYIKPIIGNVKLDDISPRMMSKFYKELQRVSRKSLSQIGEKGIKLKFPTQRGCNSTVLVLKEPKTRTKRAEGIFAQDSRRNAGGTQENS